MIISKGNLTPESLSGQVAIVTGAGAGIGLEAARALAWLGAKVIIAEINIKTGKAAAGKINEELGKDCTTFVQTDVGDEKSVHKLAKTAFSTLQRVDILLNNAAVEPIGAVKDVSIAEWDHSYSVNLRGPVLLCREFLPGMLKRNHGVVACVASVGGAYMGPYETMKAAQVELASTLDAECEGTAVSVFTIGPGFIPETPGAQEHVQKIASLMGQKIEEFYEMAKGARISMEAAGAGFAAAIAYASNFRGKTITSFEGLQAAGISLDANNAESAVTSLDPTKIEKARDLLKSITQALDQRNVEWKNLGSFQRKWMFGDFAKRVGMGLEDLLNRTKSIVVEMNSGRSAAIQSLLPAARKLANYYEHMQELTRGYVKDQGVLGEQLQLQRQWQQAAQELAIILS